MLNVAGPSFDLGAVVYAVLQDLEHRRRSFDGDEAAKGLRAAAVEKLAQIHAAYVERGGPALYWRAVEREVLGTALPQYVPAAIEKTRLERSGYDVWRGGDLLARAAFALAGLAIGGLIIATPFIPIVEDAFAFALALAGWFYPEVRRLPLEFRHSRLLNRLIADADVFQHKQLPYVTAEELEAEPEPARPAEMPNRHGARATRRELPS